MYIEGIYLNTNVDTTFDNMMSSIAEYTGSVKTDSPRDFLKALAAAVERSKIIMALGPLNGKTGLINIMSKGLALPMTAVDWEKMGIDPIIDTLLPKGAVPLMSNNNEMVGMILESGNQSIIVLSDEVDKRVEMLEMYIEPYIGAKSLEPETDMKKPEESNVNDELRGINAEAYIENSNYIDFRQSAIEQLRANEHQYIDAADYSDVTDMYDDIGDEPNVNLDELFDSKASGNRIGFIEEKDFVLEDEPKKIKKPKKSKKFLIPILVLLLLAALGLGYFGYTLYYMPGKCREDYAALRLLKDDMGDGNLPEGKDIVQYGKLYQMNNDMIGWLNIADTKIDYPVVSAAEADNEYYKKHTFSGVHGSYGTPYINDKYDIHEAYPLNLAIFGNNTGDGEMFSELENYLNLEFYKKHPIITMNSIFYDDSWKIVSIMPMDKSLTTAAIDYTYSYTKETSIDKDYIDALSTYSFINCADTADTDDYLLTLITPYSKDKDINIVVTARRIRENESLVTNTAGASYNSSAKLSDAVTAAIGDDATTEDYFNFFFNQKLKDSPFSQSVRAAKGLTLDHYQAVVPSAQSYMSGFYGESAGDEIPSSIIDQIVVNNDESARDLVVSNSNKDLQIIVVPSTNPPSSSKPASSDNQSSSSSAVSEPGSSDNSSELTSQVTPSESEQSSDNSSSSGNTSSSSGNLLYYDPNYKSGITLKIKVSSGTCYTGDAVDLIAEIVEAEMGSRYSVEALKAQAVAAFTYVVYHGGTKSAVSAPLKEASLISKASTQAVIGEIMQYNGKNINAVYSASAAGYSADAKTIWGSKIPYLLSVVSPYDSESSKYLRVKTFTPDKVAKTVKEVFKVDLTKTADKNKWFNLTYDANNKYVSGVIFGNETKSIRGNSVYSKFQLGSAAFTVEYDKEKNLFVMTSYGWGHGVGMSQVGANGFAKRGYSYRQILEHYYSGINIVKYNPN